jgi:uncharacterized membrane protein YhaH (DUF805 family)
MSFQDAVKICLQQKYADFNGRARRSEFWYFFLFSLLASAAGAVLDMLFHTRPSAIYTTGVIQTLIQLVLLVPGLAVGARRLHDISRSGWWLLINAIPLVGQIILVVWAVQDSHADNQYGPSPKVYEQLPPPVAV